MIDYFLFWKHDRFLQFSDVTHSPSSSSATGMFSDW